MKVLLSLNYYANLTGSEIYVYELARVLKSRGHEVAIIATVGFGDLFDHTHTLGIPVYDFFDHPELVPDVIHTSQPEATVYALRFFPTKPIVTTIHSELSYEAPILDPRIRRYIGIRPSILDKYADLNMDLIYNGVDFTRFNTNYKKSKHKKPVVLFVGTADQLRYPTVMDLMGRAKRGDIELKLIGRGFPTPAMWNIEKEVQECDQTASVLLGRTTIEGWASGKHGWIYDIDDEGKIRDIALTKPPTDMNRFNIEYMTDKIVKIYEAVV